MEFTCQKCEGTFEIELSDLADGSEFLECPHCGNKVTKAQYDDLSNALAELQSQLAALSKKFTVSFEIDSEELEDLEEEDEDDDDDEVAEEDDER